MSAEEDELPEITGEMQEYIDDAIRGAAECVLWQASDASEDGGRGFPITDGGNEWSEKVVSDVPYITEAVTAFVQGNWALLQIAAAYRKGGYDGGQCGHDLILTANGHGVGFWDRGLDMPAYDREARIAWTMGHAAYKTWLLEHRGGACLKTVGDALTANAKGYSFDAEFDLDENDDPTWIMVENIVLLDLVGYSSDPGLPADDPGEECDECGNRIPVVAGGSIANHHHKESCSLHDPDAD